jgi:UDP-N-acetyl-D-galactosamine dehydrogenase
MYKEFKICVIGLGYVGLPLAVSFSKHFSTIGFDINKKRINNLKKNIDTNNELYGFRKKKLLFTCLEEDIKNSNFYVIAVPTPVNKKNLPDLRNLIKASRLVGSVLKKK